MAITNLQAVERGGLIHVAADVDGVRVETTIRRQRFAGLGTRAQRLARVQEYLTAHAQAVQAAAGRVFDI